MSDSIIEFQEVYNAFQPKINRYLTKLVGAFEAEDLTQEVFVKISKSLDGFRGESQLSTWLYRIATNAALDKMRSPSYQLSAKAGSFEDLAGYAGDATRGTGQGALCGKSTSVDQEIVRKEANGCVRGLVESLPEKYRTVVVLSEIEELRNQEIARILGVSLETIKIRLHRGRAMLREELTSHCSSYYDERNELACEPNQ